MGIEYRLAYSDPARPRDYTRARWAGPPAQLIQQRLIQQLGLMSSGQGKARCVLRIDIDAFNQVFDDPASSRGQLQGSARSSIAPGQHWRPTISSWKSRRQVPTRAAAWLP
jgi:cholesterol transport system auxiliary component